MAVFRTAPKCPKCGKEYKGIYRTNNDSFIGDDFIKWDIEGHVCEKASPPITGTAEEAAKLKYPDCAFDLGDGQKINTAIIQRQFFIEGWMAHEGTQSTTIERLTKALLEIKPHLNTGLYEDDAEIDNIIDEALSSIKKYKNEK